jgi:hypothetical protein
MNMRTLWTILNSAYSSNLGTALHILVATIRLIAQPTESILTI